MKAFTYDDILLVPSYNHWESRKVVDISMRCKKGKLSLELPLMTANMDTITETGMANFIGAKGGIGVLHRYLTIENNVRMFKDCRYPVFVSVGCGTSDLKRAEALRDAGADFFCIDEDKIIMDIIGGLRSGLTYGGAATIAELQRKLDYIEITTSGGRESFTHGFL